MKLKSIVIKFIVLIVVEEELYDPLLDAINIKFILGEEPISLNVSMKVYLKEHGFFNSNVYLILLETIQLISKKVL